MTTRNINASITNRTISSVPKAVGEGGPIPLADLELEHIAAASSKLGGSTEGRGLLGSPLTLSA